MKVTHPPERVAAVIVGIETYAGGVDWTLHGPGMDALLFARWLTVDRGVPASNVRLFVSLAQATTAVAAVRDPVLAALAAIGLKPGEPTQKALVEALHKPALPEALGDGGPGGLVVFWSGHGFVDDRTRSRRLFCADANSDFGYAIDLSDLASRWRTMPELARLDEQWVIADACSQWLSTLGVTPLVQDVQPPPVLVHDARQYALFATAAGEFARTDASQNVSVFTHAVLALLPDDGWPDLEALWTALVERFKDSSQSPVAERYDPDGRVAFVGGNTRPAAYELLSDLKGVRNGWIRRAYAQTVFHLPEAAVPDGFADAMRLLAALVGSRSAGSFTLNERFLVRLAHICREEGREAAAGAIDAWLDEHVVDQPGLTSERESLARPAPRVATLRVWIPPADTPAEIHAVLDLGNGTSPSWTPAGKAAATSDAAIAGALRFALATLAAQPRSQRPEELVFELRVPARRLVERLDTLELDITDPDDVLAVDPTLVRLGRDRIVFLRVADRGAASGPKIEWDRAWQQVGERLHRGDIFTVHWIAAIGDAPWAHDFTAFPWIGFTFRAADVDPRRSKALFRALSMGAPFLVWPTEDPVDPAAAGVFQRKVSARLRASSLATLAGDLVRYRREAGDPAVFSIIVDQPQDGTEPSALVQPAQKST